MTSSSITPIPIRVSRKILADIGRGIYRTPGNALKELVSNSFDAQAKHVWITTNAPYFDTFTCEDDGEGMTPDEFIDYIRNVGSSTKRKGEDHAGNRPIIGKIGIGFFAVSQICNRLTVISKKKGTKNYFRAKIDLTQFDRDEPYRSGRGDIDLGECYIEKDIEAPPEEKDCQYTKVIMDSLREGFTNKLADATSISLFAHNQRMKARRIRDLKELIDFISANGKKGLREISQYDLMLWELGLLCPVEYIDGGPFRFPHDAVSADAERLKNYSFKVYIDGLEIRKPLLFPTDSTFKQENADFRLYYPIQYNGEVEGEVLSFHGYVFSQRARIVPPEIQGILVRIRDVAIGTYDKTLLHYPKEEGPIFSLISGEIFVEKGLEAALNIDRNSFNETHPHFEKLSEVLWTFVKKVVVGDIRTRSNKRNLALRVERSEDLSRQYCEWISSETKSRIRLVRSSDSNEKPYVFDDRTGKLTVYKNPWWERAQQPRYFQEKALLAYYAAKCSENGGNFEEIFLALLGRR
jgi:hypothetical protein